jgi:hypothetical protein
MPNVKLRETKKPLQRRCIIELCDGIASLFNLKGLRWGRSVAKLELLSGASHADTEENQDDACSG